MKLLTTMRLASTLFVSDFIRYLGIEPTATVNAIRLVASFMSIFLNDFTSLRIFTVSENVAL